MQNRKLFTQLFWIDAVERAIFTFAEVLGGFLIVDLAVEAIDWSLALQVALIATAGALLKAIAAAAKADTDTASFTVDTKELK